MSKLLNQPNYYRTKKQDLLLILQKLEKTNNQLAAVNEKLEHKVKEVSFLHKVATDLMTSYDLSDLLESILNMALNLTKSEVGCILLTGNKPEELKIEIDAGGLSEDVKNYFLGQCNWVAHLIRSPKIKMIKYEDAEFHFLRKFDSSLRSVIAVPLKIEGTTVGLIIVMHRHTIEDEHEIEYSLDDQRTLSIFAQQAALILDNTRLKILHAQKDLYLKTITALTSAIDAKDIYTQNHSQRVAAFSVELARELKLPEKEITNINYGAILHDIGKIGIAENILNKKGRLDEIEFEHIKTHPVIGAKILEPIDFLTDAKNIVRYHHERYDGKGYPDGLKREEIPYSARIVGIADAWDAMTSNRSYRAALSYEQALQEIDKGSGSQFDPYMATVFINMIKTKFSMQGARQRLKT